MSGGNRITPANAAKTSIAPLTTGLEDRVAIQHREIHALLVDNQRLAATHVALKQELAAIHLELCSLSPAAADAKARSDAQIRDAYDRWLRADADSRLALSAADDLERVRGDVRKLAASRDELASELKEAEGDLAGASEGLKQVKGVQAEIDSVRREIQRGRAAIEREKKTRAYNLDFRKAMEEKMVSLASEIEKLHADIANAHGQARAASAATKPNTGYGTVPFYSDVGYGEPYPEPYNMRKVRSVGESNIAQQYGSGPMSHGSGDLQQANMFR